MEEVTKEKLDQTEIKFEIIEWDKWSSSVFCWDTKNPWLTLLKVKKYLVREDYMNWISVSIVIFPEQIWIAESGWTMHFLDSSAQKTPPGSYFNHLFLEYRQLVKGSVTNEPMIYILIKEQRSLVHTGINELF